ncbi:hypothetical protein ACVBEH_21410, partial [Roseateles sp. GG27B]
ASAQTADLETAERVNVSGQKVGEIVKFNVSQTCQGISATLQDELAPQWLRYQATGQVRVDFKLTGNEVSAVSTKGGPREYSQAIKRAVRQLNCDSHQQMPENYAFLLVFIDPDQAPAEHAQVAQASGPEQIARLSVDGH